MKYIFYLSILFCAVFLFSCSNANLNAETQEYLIKVDSVQLPDTVAAGLRFDMRFYGTIGSDDCHSFAGFVVSEDSASLSLMLKGHKEVSANRVCEDLLVSLDGKVYSHKFTEAGQYSIRFINPGVGQVIQKELLVVAP